MLRAARRAIRNSLVLALSSATIISLLGALVAYVVVKTRLRGRGIIDLISSMPYALPGTVVGVAMILAWLKPLPLIAPGLFAGWFLVFMPTLRELTISILLWSTKHETIGVMVFNLQESGNTVASAALAVIMMLVLLIANIATRKLTRGRVGF